MAEILKKEMRSEEFYTISNEKVRGRFEKGTEKEIKLQK